MVFLCRHGIKVFKLGNARCPTLSGIKRYSQKSDPKEAFVPFMQMIENHRNQAARSILVQVQSAQSYKQLHTYCESLGKVKTMLHYSEGSEPMHFIVVEFETESDVKNVLESSTHIQETQLVPTTSQFLWFRAATKKLNKLKQSKQAELLVENGTHIISEDELRVSLGKCDNVSDQINQLYNLTRLNDVGQRLRFLTARQVESTVSGLFPKVCAFPFGSSVNGCGKMGCDLDLVVRFTQDKENESSRLIYHCKAASGSERSSSQRNMETIGDLIHLFLPGCSQVRRILQARVPIIKYHQQFTNIDCDLSLANMSGVYMSDFLYLMGEIDSRVRPLIFTVRKWAKEVYLTNASPGRWISNFSLTLLVLAFLQKPLHSPPVLPTLNELVKLASPNDQFVTDDGVNCSFLRDINKLKFKTRNTSSLEELLLEFFEHYSQFDFTHKAICLNEPVPITKPEFSPLYIVNPLERGLNVSKNVSIEELERLKLEVRNAAWLLETNEKERNNGLLAIFQTQNDLKNKIQFNLLQKNSRLMEVSALFSEGDEKEDIEYKNEEVKKEVQKIKNETKQQIKALEVKRRKSGR